MDINLSTNSRTSRDSELQLPGTTTHLPQTSSISKTSPFDNETISPVSLTRKRTRLEAGLAFDSVSHLSDQPTPLDQHHWNIPIHDVLSNDDHPTESSQDLEKEALEAEGLFDDWDDTVAPVKEQLSSSTPTPTQSVVAPLKKRVRFELPPSSNPPANLSNQATTTREYEWDPNIESMLHTVYNRTEPPQDLEKEALEAEGLFHDWDENESSSERSTFSSGHLTEAQLQGAMVTGNLSEVTSKIIEALQQDNSLSHTGAMQVALAFLLAKRETKAHEKAIKSVFQVFNKLLQIGVRPNSSPSSNLEHKKELYDADVQKGLELGFSEERAYETAMIRAGQRAFYSDPNRTFAKAEKAALDEMKVAHNYFLSEKNVPLSLLPKIPKSKTVFLPLMTRSVITFE